MYLIGHLLFRKNRQKQADSSKVAVRIVEGTQEVRESNRYQTWNLPTGARFRIGKGGPGGGDRAAAFSPNGQYLAVSSSTGIWLYDTVNYREIALLPSQYPVNSIAFSPDWECYCWNFKEWVCSESGVEYCNKRENCYF